MWCVLSALWPKTKSEELSYNQNFMEWIDLDNVNIPLKLKTARKHCTRKLFYKCKSNQRQNIRGAKNYKFQWDYVHFRINEFIQHQIHGSQQSPKMHCFLSFCPYEMHAGQFLTIFFSVLYNQIPSHFQNFNKLINGIWEILSPTWTRFLIHMLTTKFKLLSINHFIETNKSNAMDLEHWV